MKLSALLFSAALATVSVTVSACGFFEHFEWYNLPEEVVEAAMALGYTDETWTSLQTNPAEYVSFENLVDESVNEIPTPIGMFQRDGTVGDTIEALFVLDFLLEEDTLEAAEVCWDYNVNHYSGYLWDDLADRVNPFGDNVQELATILGWTKETWDDMPPYEEGVPDSECMRWLELDPIQRFAARGLGWNILKWAEAPCDPRCPKSDNCPDN